MNKKMFKLFYATILALFFTVDVFAQSTAAQQSETGAVASNGRISLVGRYLPENLSIKYLLNEPKALPVQILAGKATILYFWVSWDEASVKELYRMEELAKTNSSTLNIYAVTNEPERTARKFLEGKKLDHLQIVVDDELSTLTRIFEYSKLPHAVVIDPNLKIVAITEPKLIIDATVTLAYFQQELNLPEKVDTPFDVNIILEDLKKDEGQFTKIDLQPFNSKYLLRCVVPGQGQAQNRRLSYINIGVKEMYQDLYQFTNARTIVEAKHPEDYSAGDRDWDRLYCFDVIIPPQAAAYQLKDMAKKYLAYASPLSASVEKRKVKVSVLQKTKDFALKPTTLTAEVPTLYDAVNAKISASGTTFDAFAFYLEKEAAIGGPVINEVATPGIFSFVLDLPKEGENTLGAALKKVGLQLVEVEREMDMLVLKENKKEEVKVAEPEKPKEGGVGLKVGVENKKK